MTEKGLERNVRRAQRLAARSPRLYRLSLGCLALLGQGWVILIVVMTLGVGGLLSVAAFRSGLGVLLVGPVLGVVAVLGIVIRALRLNHRPHHGLPVTREQAPRLFETLDEFHRTLGGPGVEAVFLTDDLNAGVMFVPRLEMFTPDRVHLMVGLPLLLAHTPEETRAILAHEYGHLSRPEERFAVRIYRTRERWLRLVELAEVQDDSHPFALAAVTTLFTRTLIRAFSGYVAYFCARSFPLARDHEYHADRIAARIVGGGVVATALSRGAMLSTYLEEEFWPALWRNPDAVPVEEIRPMHQLAEALQGSAPYRDGKARLEAAMAVDTGLADTHPALKDRLSALEAALERVDPPVITAARAYLGGEWEAWMDSVDDAWRDVAREAWETRREFLDWTRRRIAELEGAETAGVDDFFEKATHLEGLGEGDAAVAAYLEVLEREPRHAGASYRLGWILLARGDASGVERIEAALREDESLRPDGWAALREYHLEGGRIVEAEQCLERLTSWLAEARCTTDEVNRLPEPDELAAHELDARTVKLLVDEVREEPFVREIWLARRTVPSTGASFHLAGVAGGYRSATETPTERAERISQLVSSLPHVQVWILQGRQGRRLRRLLRRVEGARVF